VISGEEDHRLEGHQFAAAGSPELDEAEDDEVLKVHRVHRSLVDPDLEHKAENEGVPEADGLGHEAEGVAEGNEGGHAHQEVHDGFGKLHSLNYNNYKALTFNVRF
jgi:hypothetical protein